MRKSYLDNLRWVTVVLVVIYHVLYMYNGEGIVGTVGNGDSEAGSLSCLLSSFSRAFSPIL